MVRRDMKNDFLAHKSYAQLRNYVSEVALSLENPLFSGEWLILAVFGCFLLFLASGVPQ